MSSDATSPAMHDVRASIQDGSYPRPQLMRERWTELDGPWRFAFDDGDVGLDERWQNEGAFDLAITVPFPFESPASGIGDTGFHRVVWYARSVTVDELRTAGFDPDSLGSAASGSGDASRLMLHFGAVDYRAMVWLNGVFLGSHEGGQTPFSFDVTAALDNGSDEQLLVVRAEDDPADVAQPRGKQDWREEPHSIWYHRTSGIWQPVWLEATPAVAVRLLHWVPDVPGGTVSVRLDLARDPHPGTVVDITLAYEGRVVGELSIPAVTRSIRGVVEVLDQRNGQAYEELLWSPENPRLIDATVTVRHDRSTIDTVASYLGLRSAAWGGGRFLLNNRPYFVRSVLNQGYWPESHLASPTPDALRADVVLTKELGFNATRLHQKIEDPRFLFWADRLGLLVWAETPGAFEFSSVAATRLLTEWTAAVERDLSHPSIVTWVPLNESWGVQHIEHNAAMRAFARSLVAVTRTLDQSRPVISNDGWEHVDSDIITVHDYESSGVVLRQRYLDDAAKGRLLSGFGPAGRRVVLDGQEIGERPVMLTEFGGISFATRYSDSDAWGYSSASGTDDFVARLTAVVGSLEDSTFLAGYCYTQLADTLQETNGLVSDDRVPKAPIEVLRSIFTGEARRP